MNALTKAQQARSSEAAIVVRDRRFKQAPGRDLESDPVGSAWFTALSASFPRGEAMFIDAVRAHRAGTPEPLGSEIRAFIRQEVNHSREHLAFNKAAEAAGYDLTKIDARVARMIGETQEKPAIVQLAVTMALEHFTAMFAHQFLAEPDAIAGGGMGVRDLWLWHAVEEIEHKGVAFDTWNHATRDWKPRRRWIMRSLVMLRVTFNFLRNRSEDALELLAQRGITGIRARWRLLTYLVAKPGILRRIAPQWLAYFRFGFHPWEHDDRALIARYDSEFADARMPQAALQSGHK